MQPDKNPTRLPASGLTAAAGSAHANRLATPSTPPSAPQPACQPARAPAPAHPRTPPLAPTLTRTLAIASANATATPVVTAAVAALAALAAVTLVVLAGCASTAKDCTARLPTSGPPAQSFITVLRSLEQAGLVVQAVSATGQVTLAPNHHCRPPPKQTLDALRSKAVQALTDRDYSDAACGEPPIVIAQACLQ